VVTIALKCTVFLARGMGQTERWKDIASLIVPHFGDGDHNKCHTDEMKK